MKKTPAILVTIIAVAAIVYFFFLGGKAPTDALLQGEFGSASGVGSEELAILNQVRSLDIDPSIFQSAVYQTLIDYSVPIPAQPVGRVNPFAPLPGVRAAQ